MDTPFTDLPFYEIPKDTLQVRHGTPDRHCWIVLDWAEAEQEPYMMLLSNITKALGLDLQRDVYLLTLDGDASAYLYRHETDTAPSYVLSFGIAPQRLGFDIRSLLYTPISLLSAKHLFVDKLADIAQDQSRKKQLWTTLQHLFNDQTAEHG